MKLQCTISATIGLLAVVAAPAQAQFAIPWSSLDCGGGERSVTGYHIIGTIGQPDAALPVLTGGEFRITLGYLARDPGERPCVADFDNGSGQGQPDGGVTVDDLIYYLALFANGSATADIDDGSGTGAQDGGVTIDDLLYFLLRFEAGC